MAAFLVGTILIATGFFGIGFATGALATSANNEEVILNTYTQGCYEYDIAIYNGEVLALMARQVELC